MFSIIKYLHSYLRKFSFKQRRHIYTLYYFRLTDDGYIDYKYTRVWSWHRDYKSAIKHLEVCGDFEHLYSHALIEKVPEGFGIAKVISCFECIHHQTNEFKQIEIPESFHNIYNFTIG